MCRFLIVIAIGAMSNLVARPDTGTVNGMVTNEDSKTVAGATVYAYPIDRPIVGIIPHNITDASGHFEIKGLSWGLYAVSGAKADEGYPEMLSAFFTRNQVTQKVTLAPETSTATLTVLLGPKAGRLTGTVTDGLTSAPLSPCTRFSWASEPNNYLLGTGLVTSDFNTLIPSSTGVLWKVWLDGYKPWYYPGTSDESAATTLRLQAGQIISGSEQESVELPNWRALGVAAAPATDAEPSARSVARGQTVDKAKYPLLPEAYRRFCCHARGRDPH